MDTVVSIHNEMNERTWRQLMEWESLHKRWANGPAFLFT